MTRSLRPRPQTVAERALRWRGGAPAVPAICASGSALGFLATRLWLEVELRKAGHTGGLLQYDSYYELSFARELKREGHWLLFKNPFGSFDAHAGLFNGPATLLRLLRPLWDGHLLAFDLVLGAVAAAVAGWFFGRLVELVSPPRRRGLPVVLALALAGGGIGFVLHTAGVYGDPGSALLGTAYWGPTWLTNDVATWELLYHAIFWAALATFVARRVIAPVALAAALAFLHPFSIASLGLVCVVLWLGALILNAAWRPDARAVAGIVFVTVAATVVYDSILPAHSRDAHFILETYKATNFHLPAAATLSFYVPAFGLAAARLVSWRRARERGQLHPAALGLGIAAVVFAAISLSADVTTAIPQPAHWIRVYPLALLLLAAAALPPVQMSDRGRARISGVSAAALIALACLDSALALRAIRNNLANAGPPVLLTSDEQALIDRLRALPAQSVVYIRPCDHPSPSTDLEYAISALTADKVGVGHVYFTPLLQARSPRYLACNQTARTLAELQSTRRYVVRDAGAGPRLPRARSLGRIGRFELSVVR